MLNKEMLLLCNTSSATLTLHWGFNTPVKRVLLYPVNSEGNYLTVDLLKGDNTFHNVGTIVLDDSSPYTRFSRSDRFENLEYITSARAMVIDPSKDAYAVVKPD